MATSPSQPPLNATQRHAIHEIESLGGTVFFVLGTDQQVVETISFRGPQFTDAEVRLLEPFRGYDLHSFGLNNCRLTGDGAIRAISHFPNLKGFSAIEVQFGDEICAALAKRKHLDYISLDGCQFTSDALRHFAHLRALTRLSFSNTSMDDSGMQYLEGLTNLTWLSLGDSPVGSSGGLKSLSKLVKLETLVLNGTRVTDEDLQWIASLQQLEYLRLDDTSIGNAGLAHLSRLPRLKTLILDNTPVTDSGLARLARLPKLEELDLTNTAVTEKGLAHLQQAPALRKVRLDKTRVPQLARDRFILYLPANKEPLRKYREQFERGDWPPKQ